MFVIVEPTLVMQCWPPTTYTASTTSNLTVLKKERGVCSNSSNIEGETKLMKNYTDTRENVCTFRNTKRGDELVFMTTYINLNKFVDLRIIDSGPFVKLSNQMVQH